MLIKYSPLSIFIILILLVSIFLAYYLGYKWGRQWQEEEQLRVNLVSNVIIYNNLEQNNNDAIRDKLILLLSNNINEYNRYNNIDPHLTKKDPTLALYFEKAKAIVNANSNRIIEVHQENGTGINELTSQPIHP